MAKLWAGRTLGDIDKLAEQLNSSVAVDSRMFRQDILGSIAHAAMLGKQGIIPVESSDRICSELSLILADIDSGRLDVDMSCEDIHTFIEQELTRRIGDEGKMLHTARSRNDQVALDTRLYCSDETDEIISRIRSLVAVLADKSSEHKDTIMPGYTHLQRAQPVSFAHYLCAYCMMLLRDVDRLSDAKIRVRVSPIGACALAGTTYDTDRFYEADKLGLSQIAMNSIDAVSDRDFIIEVISALSILMMHLSRFSEEMILWSSWEFKFIEFDDKYTTGSSIMPQKKNPDMAELVRGKTGRVYGDLVAMLTIMKGLPLAYNKDMQEDKERLFDSLDTVKLCLDVFTPMVRTMRINSANMRSAAGRGFINATDLADYLVCKGMPFRTAYKISGEIVAECISSGLTLEEFPLSGYKKFTELFDEGVYDAVDLLRCMNSRNSVGGTSAASVDYQLRFIKDRLS